ncbi:MAG: hypothetical protein NVSMB9_26120 [Isosphaeraceae bacterium]
MIDLECPHCGRPGSIPSQKINSRLVCKKCHLVFHLTTSGRAVPGEPTSAQGSTSAPDPKAARHADTGGAEEGSFRFEGFGELRLTRSQGIVLLVLAGVIVLRYFFLSGPHEDALSPKAQRAADALVSGNLGYLKGLVTPESVADVDRWHKSLQTVFENVKKQSTTGELMVTVLVLQESHANRLGQAMVFVAPAVGIARNEAIAAEAGAVPFSKTVQELTTHWELDGAGKWRLDARKSMETSTTPGAR